MKNGYVFVSIMGTQIMGTLQPLMAFVQKFGPVDIVLFHTTKTESLARTALDFINTRQLGQAEMAPVSNQARGEDSTIARVVAIAQKAQAGGGRVCFNLDGGMNFMISACVIALEPFKPLLIQTTRTRTVLQDMATDEATALPLPQVLPVEKILELQGINFAIDSENPASGELEAFFEKEGIDPPANSVKNVSINGHTFEYVWNNGNNRLNFFKDCRKADLGKEKKLADRRTGNWSIYRKLCNEMHDKELLALVADHYSRQRLEEFSNGRIRVYHAACSKGESANGKNGLNQMRQFFGRQSGAYKEGVLPRPKKKAKNTLKDDTLVVCLGTNLPPTLTAIASHKPRHVLLCRNETDPVLSVYAENIVKFKDEFGLESVTLAKYPVEGHYPDDYLPQGESEDCRISVNITPGTKGQAGFLSLWAKRHGFGVWSIHNGASACSPIANVPEDSAIPMEICDPVTVFKILGKTLLDEGQKIGEIREDFQWIDPLLEFMRRLDAADRDINEIFTRHYVKLGEDSLKKKSGTVWKLTLDGKNYDIEKGEGGYWYEKVIARALEQAGGEKIRLNVRLRWDEGNEKHILQKLEAERKRGNANRAPAGPHMLEVDVIGLYQSNIVHISVKSYPLGDTRPSGDTETLDEALANAASSAANHGRFALSVITDLASTKMRNPDNSVLLLGWPEICHPEKMGQRIREHTKSKSTNN